MLTKNIFKKFSVLPILLLILLSASPTLVQAGFSVGTAPTSKTLELDAGETYTDEIVFWNLSEDTDTYNIYIRGFEQIENQPGTAIILSEEDDAFAVYSASKWITVNKQQLELEPHKNVKLEYTIKVPYNVTDGEYNAEIFLISESADDNGGTQAFTSLASGMPILITVGDEYVENAELLRFTTDKKAYEKINVDFLTKIKNLGDTHIRPSGEIVIENIFKQEVARIPFNTNKQSLLRDNVGNYEDNWSQPSYLSPTKKIAIGPMKASLVSTYRSYQPGFATLTAQTTFWIIPWKWVIGILVVLITGTIYVSNKRRTTRRR